MRDAGAVVVSTPTSDLPRSCQGFGTFTVLIMNEPLIA